VTPEFPETHRRLVGVRGAFEAPIRRETIEVVGETRTRSKTTTGYEDRFLTMGGAHSLPLPSKDSKRHHRQR